MTTTRIFTFGIIFAAFIVSIKTSCPYDDWATYTLTEIAKKKRGVESTEGDSDTDTTEDRSDAYKLGPSKWDKTHLTWKMLGYSKRLSKEDVDKTMRRAFKSWSDVCNLTFQEIPSTSKKSADIEFTFVPTLDAMARGTYPKYGGTVRFNDSKDWTINSYTGSDFRNVATHEIGHCLGLDHPDERVAVMAAYYPVRGNPDFELEDDDIAGIQKLYGARPGWKRPVRKSRPAGATGGGNPLGGVLWGGGNIWGGGNLWGGWGGGNSWGRGNSGARGNSGGHGNSGGRGNAGGRGRGVTSPSGNQPESSSSSSSASFSSSSSSSSSSASSSSSSSTSPSSSFSDSSFSSSDSSSS